MKRAFKIGSVGNDGDIVTEVSVRIIARPGTLTTCEANRMRDVAADQFMIALKTIPDFNPSLCDMKVRK